MHGDCIVIHTAMRGSGAANGRLTGPCVQHQISMALATMHSSMECQVRVTFHVSMSPQQPQQLDLSLPHGWLHAHRPSIATIRTLCQAVLEQAGPTKRQGYRPGLRATVLCGAVGASASGL